MLETRIKELKENKIIDRFDVISGSPSNKIINDAKILTCIIFFNQINILKFYSKFLFLKKYCTRFFIINHIK